MSHTPIIFIYQKGFRQISLPPVEEGLNNFDVINITSCDDGCLITTEGDLQSSYEKLKQFIGREVVEVYCDTNEISKGYYLTECKLTKGNYGEDCILVWTSRKEDKND